jgi:hypothetical protein
MAGPVNVLIVIGPEKLTIEMEKLLASAGVKVLRLDKSGGVSFSLARLGRAYVRFRSSSSIRPITFKSNLCRSVPISTVNRDYHLKSLSSKETSSRLNRRYRRILSKSVGSI